MGYRINYTIENGIERIVYTPDKPKFKTPILMQHGMWHGAWCWQPWQELFADRGWECHAFSLPGHGKSTPRRHHRWCTLQHYYGFLAAEIKRMLRPPVLMGHSMGGALTQWHLKQDGTVPAAVLVASWASRSNLRSLFNACFRFPMSVLLSFATFSASPAVRTPRIATEFFLTEGALLSPEEFHARLCPESLFVILQYLPPFWKPPFPTKTPILWLAGSRDVVTDEPIHRASAADYGADYIMVDGAGHDLMLEKSSHRTAEAIHRWLVDRHIP